MFSIGPTPLVTHDSAGLIFRLPNADFTLRALTPDDRAEQLSHLKRLPPEDRNARFQGGMSDLALERYLDTIRWDRMIAIGIFEGTTLRGVGEMFAEEDGATAELAFSVERDFQHLGFGKILMEALTLIARQRGLTEVRMIFLRDNNRMGGLARKAGAVATQRADLMEGVLPIPTPLRDAKWMPLGREALPRQAA